MSRKLLMAVALSGAALLPAGQAAGAGGETGGRIPVQVPGVLVPMFGNLKTPPPLIAELAGESE